MPSSGRWRRRLTRLLPPKSVQQDHGARRHAGAAGAWSGHGPRGHGGPARRAHVAGDVWLGCVGHSRVAGNSSAPQLPSLRKRGPQRPRLICTARLTHRPRATLTGADQALPTTPFEIRIVTAGADRRAGVYLGSRRNGRVVAASTAGWLVDGRLRGADIHTPAYAWVAGAMVVSWPHLRRAGWWMAGFVEQISNTQARAWGGGAMAVSWPHLQRAGGWTPGVVEQTVNTVGGRP
ncbi:hypothetical protein FHR48_002750 [Xanthomonas arboricola]|nr:hypothetical protein [Xanthomonas cannabis]NIK65186.1 hypothetical protein [Xanthomonas cannabis]